MRKMKKINGYLVVRFNDRELREWEGTALGNYGVIDAELYTGTLEVDRSVMEYDDAETIEEAIKKARDLESELDVEEPEVKVTVIAETDTSSSEAEVNPEGLFNREKVILKRQIKSPSWPDTDPRAATYTLYGYARALYDLGMIEETDERFLVTSDTFEGFATRDQLRKEQLAYVCDEVCKERIPGRPQEELDAVCAECALERLANEAGESALRVRGEAHRELNGLIEKLRHAENYQTRRIATAEARAYLRALEASRMVTKAESTAFAAAIVAAVEAGHSAPPREKFENLGRTHDRRVYGLGLLLAEDCPENDCRVYLNTFNMARELDIALDTAQGYAVDVLRRRLVRLFKELRDMYVNNYAVKKYKEGMQP